MEFSVPGFIKKCCTPNALLTLAEYIEDYADDTLAEKGWLAIEKGIGELEESVAVRVRERLEKIRNGERDLYF